MTLYIENPKGTFNVWSVKGRVEGMLLPRNCERVWSPTELAAHKLYSPMEADAVPSGMRVVSTVVQRVDGVVRFVNVTEMVTQAEIDAALEAQVQSNADDILQNDKKFRVVLWLIYQIILAVRTGDTTKLDTVTSMEKLRDIVVTRLRKTN